MIERINELEHNQKVLLEHLEKLTYIVESMAHLQNKEQDLLPFTESARTFVANLNKKRLH